jgi:hypothetical protein
MKRVLGEAADAYAGIDPTVLRLGDADDFESGSFDHSFDNVDSRSALRATLARVRSTRQSMLELATKVIESDFRRSSTA